MSQEELNDTLILSAFYEPIDVIKELLEKGADANARNRFNATVLDIALVWNSVEVVELLLEYGSNVVFNDIVRIIK